MRSTPTANRAASALRLAAQGLVNSHSALGAYYRRMRARLGAPKSMTATAHKLARLVYSMLRLSDVTHTTRLSRAYDGLVQQFLSPQRVGERLLQNTFYATNCHLETPQERSACLDSAGNFAG